MAESGMEVTAFEFEFDPPLDTWARWFAVVPTRSFVRVDASGFEAVYGPWRVASAWSNVAAVERTGPYRAWRVGGPARWSLADRGITMAATTRGGVCVRLRRSVGGIDPFGVIRHPAVTLGVSDVDEFIRVAEDRIAAGVADGSGPPIHRRGRLLPVLRALVNWRRRDVAHAAHDVRQITPPIHDRAGGLDDQPIEVGCGPAYHRTYRIAVRGSALSAARAMAAIQADPNTIADQGFAPFTKARGRTGEMRVGDRYVIQVAGPWKGAVEVIEVTPCSFRLATLEGHMESGTIDMRTSTEAADDGEAELVLTIESWARSHDRPLHLLYDKLGIAKALQSEMWSVACDRFAAFAKGRAEGSLEVVTERAG